ncbi:glycoside hydrolase family 35 protein [Microbacterium oleivorans]|uniref:glycoside hydrolase family 35 protein n=1 Tax=Microbacterium oleivorans TaxID=273677 RepID=UPI000562AE9E|nr:beta-galactosidase family protein [Microbacterium oleivorans]THE07056.1 beta-galactosidase [Microbacterium oleivorans]
MSTFAIGDRDFLLDGRPHRIISGALHYFRVHPGDWADRIRKARLMGLNTIETYVAWNAHEPVRGEWSESDGLDLGHFLDLVAAEGLHAIVRPGPYICAEWHNGGLPTWLTATPGIRLRQTDAAYQAALETYLRRVYRIVAPRQIDRGGNVVLVQIENEYGAYGSDKDYLAELVRVTRDSDITVPLTTVDQPEPDMLAAGSLEGVHLTGSFGSRADERLAVLRAHQPTGPLMCSEFWDGWFDWWGGQHHTTHAATAAAELDGLLAAGASVNIYMFHGGTNFGATNGANDKGRYLPIVTSYDYDAPLDEAGDPTEKFHAFRDVIAKYADVPADVPAESAPRPEFSTTLSPATAPSGPEQSSIAALSTFEDAAHTGTLLRYEAMLPDGFTGGVLAVGEVRDQAWVSVDGIRVGSLSRTRHEHALRLPGGRALSILVEEQGRVNYDDRLGEKKGLIGPVTVDGHDLEWRTTPVLLEHAAAAPELLVAAGEFDLEAPTDLFLDTTGWGKGYVFVGDFLLGRYWSNGPQQTLYVPAPVTRAGVNALTVIELEQPLPVTARFTAAASLGPLHE